MGGCVLTMNSATALMTSRNTEGETGSYGGLCGGYRGSVCPLGTDGKATMDCVDTILDVLTTANAEQGGTTTYAAGTVPFPL